MTREPAPVLLGGSAAPVGWKVRFVAAPAETVLEEIVTLDRGYATNFGRRKPSPDDVTVRGPVPYPECLELLYPLQTPYSRELVIACGEWTAYTTNAIGGGAGDGGGALVVAGFLDARCVSATNLEIPAAGHAGTQFAIQDPQPEALPETVRSIYTQCEDGRWSWGSQGEHQDFERPERYALRTTRDRFDRDLLIHYLNRLGIPVDDPTAFGPGYVVERRHPSSLRSITKAQALEYHAQEPTDSDLDPRAAPSLPSPPQDQ